MSGWASGIVLISFWGLLLGTIAQKSSLQKLRTKPWQDWLLDSCGLLIQGFLIPLLQLGLVYQVYRQLLPVPMGWLQLPAIVTFVLSFVVVDYLYYWNHRLLHSPALWSLHQVHHTVTEMDVLGTSRNTLWTSLLILYLWAHALLIYLLHNPNGYLLGVSLTSALDLWRHSPLGLPPQSWVHRWLAPWLILPQDHAWHHASPTGNWNYGANLKLWDRLHGTYLDSDHLPEMIGMQTHLTLSQQLFCPWTQEKRHGSMRNAE